MVRYILFSSLIAASAIFITLSLQSAPAQTPPAPANPDVLPDGPGKSAVEHDCLSCHGARMLRNTPGTGTADDWVEIVNKMMSQGADVSDGSRIRSFQRLFRSCRSGQRQHSRFARSRDCARTDPGRGRFDRPIPERSWELQELAGCSRCPWSVIRQD
jgi:cytochrome c5